MVDIVDKAVRSKMMAGIKAKNTKPELLLRRFLHSLGFRYRIHVGSLPGSPDLVLAKYKLAIFVHGCFWHQHSGCRYAAKPDVRGDQWSEKFAVNQARDEQHLFQLRSLGWRVFLIWECGITKGKNRPSLEWLPYAIKDIKLDFISWPNPIIQTVSVDA
ncbi:very short patch repair endonuclease [Janthinobacterium lividum]|uniref:very short patch repair endonuclease n=1 Tax=Janthinobacterium lividum TaxID=29581 RepID=UPI0015952B90|nr:DNA mismatch endonuclease Vsr [Janthinobacterium lividum]QKY06323.1 DNA mismatch endonuclease Vsr [Janthinobacterium lividum]